MSMNTIKENPQNSANAEFSPLGVEQ